METSNLDLWSALVALAVPWITAVIARSDWPSTAKWGTFAVVSVLSATGTAYFTGQLTGNWPDGLIRSLLIIAVLATGAYKGWEPAVRQVERATG